jgi:hypothetical protein
MSPSQAAGYSGSPANGSVLDIGYVWTPETEINNEPILEGEIPITLNQDTLLARYYAAGIHRLIFQGAIVHVTDAHDAPGDRAVCGNASKCTCP